MKCDMAENIVSWNDYEFDPRFEYGHGGWSELGEFHDSDSVELGELIEVGWFDLSDKVTWNWPKYNDEQDERLREKINNRFWSRGIGVLPPGLWKRQFLELMAEIMPKYIYMYKVLDEDGNIPGHENEWYKSRNIFSDFPQTQLGGNSDYASTGNDTEYERIRRADVLDTIDRLKDYRDVDAMILDELEQMFSSLISVSLNTR